MFYHQSNQNQAKATMIHNMIRQQQFEAKDKKKMDVQ